MSMQAWDAPNPAENGAFNPTLDPSMAFAGTPTSSNFDFSMPNAHLQRMQNGNMRNGNGSPVGFQNPMYQTSSVIPSKRPLDFTGSPRQASRSQTPQQGPYGGFTGTANGQTPNPYQHLQQQQNSSNTSPSPIMQNQQFNPPGIPPRMQTASPSPFSPSGPNFAPQASPVQSDYGNRVDTPSNGAQSFMQGNPYANGMGGNPQAFNSPSGPMIPPGFGSFNPASMTSEQQRMLEAKQQNMIRQLQANNAAAQQQHHMSRVNPIANAQNQIAMQQQAAMRQQNMRNMQNLPHGEGMPAAPDDFARAISQFMGSRGMPFNKDLIVGGRTIPCGNLFFLVMRMGGSKNITMTNGWPQVAMQLTLHPTVAPEISTYWQQNLQAYEAFYLQQRRTQQQQARLQMMQRDGNIPGQVPPGRPSNLSPEQIVAAHARRQSSASFQTPGKAQMPGQQDPRQAQMNGFSPPRELMSQSLGTGIPGQHALQKSIATQDPEGLAPATRGKVAQAESSTNATDRPDIQPRVKQDWKTPRKNPMSDTFKPTLYYIPKPQPKKTSSPENEPQGSTKPPNEFHGGIIAPEIVCKRNDQRFPERYLDYPQAIRYGNIDIHALTMSLKSGLPGEVRLALDMLTSLTDGYDRARQLPPLSECDDLVESLIDCAEIQLDLLADNAPEVSDVMMISPYEDLIRNCYSDIHVLQDVSEFGSLDYELDRAADRLLCISTILRNLTVDLGHGLQGDDKAVADAVVVKFFATVIRYLGTRNNLLRTNWNTLDFTKDVVICLSKVSEYIIFSSKDEALCILQFLLSFGPLPHPTIGDNNNLSFTMYTPALHRYLPPAIQALAKLLASGDPNRGYLKSLFATDLASTPSLDLLTRAFGLCIAPVPVQNEKFELQINYRAHFLTQGLLAAESLVLLIPPTENKLAYAWLSSEDGFAHRLLRVIAKVGINHTPIMDPATMNPAMRHRNVPQPQEVEIEIAYNIIYSYGIAVLRRLGERAKDAATAAAADGGGGGGVNALVAANDLSKRNVLQEALQKANVDPRLVQQLSAYSSLDD